MGTSRTEVGNKSDESQRPKSLERNTMTILLTFILTTAGWGALLALALRRVAMHLKDNPEGVEAISKHVLVPILGRRAEQPRKTEGPTPASGRRGAERD
jgi:hypothetical protein